MHAWYLLTVDLISRKNNWHMLEKSTIGFIMELKKEMSDAECLIS